MGELNELYQEVILDHNRHPRNFGSLEEAERKAEGYNPLCGDQITVYLKMNEGVIEEVTFKGSGCAISTASASIMTETVKGKTPGQAEALFSRFHALVTGKAESTLEGVDLGKLVVFHQVSHYPVRVKCATLPWHTLRAALQRRAETISTESNY
ncbi:MAG: Fe-S cluster assembly sulfur transfer protein SufU [Acidobacteriota bacterium]